MSRTVALVVPENAPESDEALEARVGVLSKAGWDAHLLRGATPRALRRLRPDLIHFHSGFAAVWTGLPVRRLPRCRIVISFRDDGQDLYVRQPERLWKADLLLFPDVATLERGVAIGCPRERAEILPHPPRAPRSSSDRRSSEPGKLRLVSVGPVIWEQGYEHSLHAVRLLLDMGVECDYRLVGEGDHLIAVAFARHQLRLADHVELVTPGAYQMSRTDEVRAVSRDGGDPLGEELSAADAFVDPAVSDTISLTSLSSARAHGLPLVTTRRDGLPADAAMVVPRRDPAAIAEALSRLARDPALRLRMGEAARRGPRPAQEEHAVRLEALYRRVLAPAD